MIKNAPYLWVFVFFPLLAHQCEITDKPEPEKLFLSTKIIVDNTFLDGGILVGKDGKIQQVLSKAEAEPYKLDENIEVIDVGENVIMSGVIDTHVHVNEPGRTAWEGYVTATKAAAAGGFTTILDMPLNSIPATTTLEHFREKLEAAKGKTFVDVAFWGGVVPGNQDELVPLVDAGVVGFKSFMCPSGVDEFPYVNVSDIETAMKALEKTNAVLAFHAEMGDSNPVEGDPSVYQTFLNTRPPTMEEAAIKTVIALAKKHNVRTHIVHLSAAGAVPLIVAAKAEGVKISVETCHHYLFFKSEEIPNGQTQYKCTPPIRDSKNQEMLWEALEHGVFDQLASDHSPCTPDLKELETGDFIKAWGGIASVQFGLSLFWTQLKNRGLPIFEINKYMTRGPAKLTGLDKHCKGLLAPGYDADLVVWDPEAKILIDESMIQFKNKLTPYLGKELYGKVFKTIVRGRIVYEDGKPFNNPVGKLLVKNDADV